MLPPGEVMGCGCVRSSGCLPQGWKIVESEPIEESWIDWLKTDHLSSIGVGEGHTV